MIDNIRGRFFWYELMTSNPEAATAFYTEVIGWKAQPWGPPEMAYTMIANEEGPVGGIADLSKDPAAAGMPQNWMAYFGTPDLDATVEQAKGLGATVVVPPTEIPTVGRFAVLLDPQGAAFAPFTPAGDPSQMPEMNAHLPGMFSWHELVSSDATAGFAFYSALFGWVSTGTMDMGPMGTYQMYGRTAEKSLGGMMNRPPEMPVSAWGYYITVADIKATMERVKSKGGQVVRGPDEVPGGGWTANCVDPQGGFFALYQPPAGAS